MAPLLQLGPYGPIPGDKVALIIIDVWDHHWCPDIEKRTNALAQKIGPLLAPMRANGVQIIHAPCSCENHYKGRIENRGNHWLEKYLVAKRAWDGDRTDDDGGSFEPPTPHLDFLEDLALLSGSDCCETPAARSNPQTQENAWIPLDESNDIVVFEWERQRLINFLIKRQTVDGKPAPIEHLVYAGTATNMCVLYTRNISLEHMRCVPASVVRHGDAFKDVKLRCYLARDLTDAALPDSQIKSFRQQANYPDSAGLTKGAKTMVNWIENSFHITSIASTDLTTPLGFSQRERALEGLEA